ncbi:hypothetical protein C2G38_2211379 [Gigaspora rosea]|uniref:Uncharacterized protein n=1 Tax=Gigaspora rosea TaxID=44941 RepID=A0A397UH60_9GLOM|nr:hypothetical protein C2G38_2211379 [Gigaspora rosea]
MCGMTLYMPITSLILPPRKRATEINYYPVLKKEENQDYDGELKIIIINDHIEIFFANIILADPTLKLPQLIEMAELYFKDFLSTYSPTSEDIEFLSWIIDPIEFEFGNEEEFSINDLNQLQQQIITWLSELVWNDSQSDYNPYWYVKQTTRKWNQSETLLAQKIITYLNRPQFPQFYKQPMLGFLSNEHTICKLVANDNNKKD